MNIEFLSAAPEETFEYGRRLGQLLQASDVVALRGDLGAGKTCFVQGVSIGAGVRERSQITSPTFTLIQEYCGRLPIYHFDVYRLNREEDLYELGFEEYFYGEGITLIEWAERIPSCLPDEHLAIYLHIAPDLTRRIRLTAVGNRYNDVLQAIEASTPCDGCEPSQGVLATD